MKSDFSSLIEWSHNTISIGLELSALSEKGED